MAVLNNSAECNIGVSDTNNLTLELGWRVQKMPLNALDLIKRILTRAYVLDTSVIICKENKFQSLSDLVYFCHASDNSGSVNFLGKVFKNVEQFNIDFSKLPNNVDRLIVALNIYRADIRMQDFRKVKDIYIKLYDSNKNELAQYNLSNKDAKYLSVLLGEFYKNSDNNWVFKVTDKGLFENTFKDIANLFK